MKINKDTEKWGKLTVETDGVSFVNEELVNLTIPLDKLNPAKERFVCINGNQIWLAAGKKLKVPQSVADLWDYSYNATIEAEEKMSQSIEINMG